MNKTHVVYSSNSKTRTLHLMDTTTKSTACNLDASGWSDERLPLDMQWNSEHGMIRLCPKCGKVEDYQAVSDAYATREMALRQETARRSIEASQRARVVHQEREYLAASINELIFYETESNQTGRDLPGRHVMTTIATINGHRFEITVAVAQLDNTWCQAENDHEWQRANGLDW
jgi:hypothetical protein